MDKKPYKSLEHSIKNIVSGSLNEVTGRYNPVTGKYEQKSKQEIEAEFAKREKANQQQAEFENTLKKQQTQTNTTGKAAKNQNIPKNPKPVDAPPAPSAAPPISGSTTPPPSSSGKPVEPKVKGTRFGGVGPAAGISAVLGGIEGAVQASKAGANTAEVVGYAGSGATQGATGLGWSLGNMALNTGEGIGKTITNLIPGADKDTDYKSTLSSKFSKYVQPDANNDKEDWATSARKFTAVRKGIYDPIADINPNADLKPGEKPKSWSDVALSNITEPIKKGQKYSDTQSWYKSLPAALGGSALGVLGGVWGAGEGALTQAARTGLFRKGHTWQDIKNIGKAAAVAGSKGFKSGLETPYRWMGEEHMSIERKRYDTIKRVIAEKRELLEGIKAPKFGELKVKVGETKPSIVAPELKAIVPKVGKEKLKDIDIEGHKIFDDGYGEPIWLDKSGAKVTDQKALELNQKLKAMTDAQSIGKQTGATGSGMKTDPVKMPPIEKQKGSSLEYADRPPPFKIEITPEPTAKLPAVQKPATGVEEIPTGQEKVFPGQGKITSKAADNKTIDLDQTEYKVVPGTDVSTKVSPDVKTQVAALPSTKTSTAIATDTKTAAATKTDVDTKVQPKPAPQTKITKLTPTKTKEKVKPPAAAGGGVPGIDPAIIAGLKGYVPIKTHLHFAQDRVTFGEAADADNIRKTIENVARPGGKTRIGKQGEIKAKIIDENAKRAAVVKQTVKDSTIIKNPKLKHPELDEN